ncbi:biotin/lipoyl-binding protein [Jeotgalibaca sp. MA1X17-3]|uniref:biotin/lipoyl-containing protein n=1 Tax=Jeotgalibaca sp. MA1X17-3 TaxID=2908211 RepID=UPI001F214F2A|nr:biotin/lipoyl-containing protein [Jeotgalibaca sp. MA1X17-3]UJF16123.1 biotin/lipoyl-binding protein [Jeotgalibaca sp. MA1X17-3]
MKKYEIEVDGQLYHVKVRELPDDASMKMEDSSSQPPVNHPISTNTNERAEDQIIAPISGTILKILVNPNQNVQAGTPLLILEAMKMENEIVAPKDGTVKKILVKPNESVDSEQVLIVF